MKTLNIKGEILDFNGKPIRDQSNVPLTVKVILLQCVGVFFTSPSAEENIEATRLGHKLYDATDTIDLEDAEFKLLNKAVNKTLTDQRYSVVVMSPILELMKSVE